MKLSKINLLALVSLGLVISCTNETLEQLDNQIYDIHEVSYNNSEQFLGKLVSGKSGNSDCSFDYEGEEGPEYWAGLCGDEWTACNGQSQSPVNINTRTVSNNDDIGEINISYRPTFASIYNNGHTIQFNYRSGSYSSMGGKTYELLQFHFHTGSEHTINDQRYPMEVHLVHRDISTDSLAVIGIIFNEGRSNRLLQKYLNNLPSSKGEYYVNDTSYLNATDFLPDNEELEDFYTYKGSLTTPGCAEIVTWFVLKNQISASAEQINKMKNIMKHNYRPVQNLNDRAIVSSED